MTANVLPRQIADAIEAGMNDHVGKPFKKEELLGAVDRWVMAQGGPSSREQSAATIEPAVLKAPAFEELVAAAGRDRALGMLERFGDQLKERFADESLTPADPERLAKNAHAAVSMAGMLGFEELSQLCRRVEESARSGGELEPLIQELKTSRDAALDQIARARQA
jgi:HPt (histidine-containing phosphotransfer) domain-containing protein